MLIGRNLVFKDKMIYFRLFAFWQFISPFIFHLKNSLSGAAHIPLGCAHNGF